MASERLDVILRLLTGDYKSEARAAADATDKIGTSATKANTGMGRLSGGLGLLKTSLVGLGIGKIVSELGDMAQAAADDAKAQETLAFAIRNNTDATDAQIAANERWITSMQIATNTADDELRAAMQSLVVTGKTVEESQRIIAGALDVAAARGKEFKSVLEAMVRAAATGSTAGLGRLGIATRDASGALLDLDGILVNIGETMGGSAAEGAATLAGAMERAAIIMEEAAEAGGGNVLGAWSTLGDGIAVFKTQVLGGNVQLAVLNGRFNQLIRQGVDPFNDKVRSATTILRGMLEQTAVSKDTFETLHLMLGLTTDDLTDLRRELEDNGTELGFNEQQVRAFLLALDIGAVEDYHNALDAGRHRRGELTTDLYDAEAAAAEARTALGLLVTKQRELNTVFLESANPTLAAIGALQRFREATERLTELRGDPKASVEEIALALADVLETKIAAQAGLDAFDAGGLQQQIEFVADVLGIADEEARAWLETLGLIDGTQVSVVFNYKQRFTTADAAAGPFIPPPPRPPSSNTNITGVRQHGGDVWPGLRYRAGEGNQPEMLLIPGDRGRVFSNSESRQLMAAFGRGGGDNHYHFPNARTVDRGAIELAGTLAGVQRRVESRR